MKKFAVFLLVLLLATTSSAGLKDRLEPVITSDDVQVSVDRFIIGTEDAYVATIVKTIGDEEIADMRFPMQEMLNKYDRKDLLLIERYVFSKNAKKMALIERNLVLEADPQAVISSEPVATNVDFLPISGDFPEETLWTRIAGPGGLGESILGDEPKPVLLSSDKSMSDTDRYVPIVKKEIGGIFLDKEDMKRTNEGCTARIVESFNFDGEVFFGGKVYQYTSLPYKDANYAVSTFEFSFAKRAYRQLRFTVFGLDQKVIYSVKIVNPVWVDKEMDPIILSFLSALSKNLPHDLALEMSADVEAFSIGTTPSCPK